MTAEEASQWRVRPYLGPGDDRLWDALVERSCNGTFLHSRLFLSYHGDRFTDRSFLVEDSRGRIRAVLPAAEIPGRPGVVISHPGVTYGGLVHDEALRGADLIEVLELVRASLSRSGATVLQYKAVPHIYHRVPAEDDIYALFRLGALRHRCDLSATIDLRARGRVSSGRRYGLGTARKSGVAVQEGWEPVDSFWAVLAENLAARHGATPVHTIAEMRRLAELFPEHVRLVTALLGSDVIAGGVIFCAGPVVHLQYAAASEKGREVGGLDAVVEWIIAFGTGRNYSYFDYGISTEHGGQVLNTGLYKYKLSFGSGGVIYDHYEVPLQ